MTVGGADGLVLDWGSGTRRERSAKKRVRVGATAEMLAVREGDGKKFREIGLSKKWPSQIPKSRSLQTFHLLDRGEGGVEEASGIVEVFVGNTFYGVGLTVAPSVG